MKLKYLFLASLLFSTRTPASDTCQSISLEFHMLHETARVSDTDISVHGSELNLSEFLSTLATEMPAYCESLSKQKQTVLFAGIKRMHRRTLYALSVERQTEEAVHQTLGTWLSELGAELDSVSSGNRGKVDALIQAASDAPSVADKADGNVTLYGYKMWHAGTALTVAGITYPGYNSCARVASAILMKAGVKTGMHDAVRKLEANLKGKGFKDIKTGDEEVGDVVIWTNDSNQNHIGIYVGRAFVTAGRQATVDNLSITGMPTHRPMYRNYPPGPWDIRRILRMP